MPPPKKTPEEQKELIGVFRAVIADEDGKYDDAVSFPSQTLTNSTAPIGCKLCSLTFLSGRPPLTCRFFCDSSLRVAGTW